MGDSFLKQQLLGNALTYLLLGQAPHSAIAMSRPGTASGGPSFPKPGESPGDAAQVVNGFSEPVCAMGCDADWC
jgi:hypothetical protein